MARVCRRVLDAAVARQVIVATDDQEIAAVASGEGAQVHLCDTPFACGTDRVAAAVRALAPDSDLVINVQGDEPLVDGAVLRAALAALEGHDLGTVGVPAVPGQDLTEPDAVKVYVDDHGRARRFHRAHLPGEGQPLIHVGIYAFTRSPARVRGRAQPGAGTAAGHGGRHERGGGPGGRPAVVREQAR